MCTTQTHCGISESSTVFDQLGSKEAVPNTLISNDGIFMFNWIVWAVLAQAVVLFGVLSNIINIVCFVKQGFKDSVNVSLTGLAISDLGSLLPLIWTNISYTPAFSGLDWSFEVSEVQYMTSAVTHAMFTRISSWITATIAIERCLCVTLPLKVKDIATPRRSCVVVVCIFLVLIVSACPQYFVYRLGNKFYPQRNRTLTGIIFTGDRTMFEQLFYPVNYVFVPFIAFIVVSACTTMLVVELKNKAKWRSQSAGCEEASKLTNANQKVAKMVVIISALFISCFIPISISCVAIITVPGFSIDGKFRNLLTVMGGLGFLLESVNSSMNIFIYYYMSSKFREVFYQTVSILKIQKHV